jgi:formylglycine-generating enzyme required for sulfatase activity
MTAYIKYCKWAFQMILSFVMALSIGCNDALTSNDLTATTLEAENITVNSADLKGSTSGKGMRSRGIVYNKIGMPILEEDDALPLKPEQGEFVAQALELQSNTQYYYRAYAFSDAGIVYGEEKVFTTLDINLPNVTMSDPEQVTANSALFKATIINAGSAPAIQERGFVWSFTETVPTLDNEKQIVEGVELGEMSFDIQSLEMNTMYYVRAYARSQLGVGYSDVRSFRTLLLDVPEISMTVTPIIKGFSTTGIISSNKTITRAGVVFSEKNQKPILSNSESKATTPYGNSFTFDLTGLKPFTLYYIAAFAIDENGTGYSEVQRIRTGTYGTVSNTLVLVQPPASYKLGWTSETDGGKDLNLFVNNSEANGNCVAENMSKFYINKYPVTNQEYCDFLNEYGSTISLFDVQYFNRKNLFRADQVNFSLSGGKWTPAEGMENHPAVGINWAGANAFCLYYGGRLPDEAEWEIAARGGKYTDTTGKTRYSGSNELAECGWYSNNSGATTQPVGQLKPNDLGLYDMSGNTYEWMDSWYQRYQGSWLFQKSLGPGSVHNKVARGGSFKAAETNCRTVYRRSVSYADESNNTIPDVSDLGFRFIMSPAAEE